MVLEISGSISCFSPEAILQVQSKFSTIEHSMNSVEQRGEFLLDAAILLRHTWGCLFEIDPQLFLIAGLFKGLIFSCVVALKSLYLYIILNF